MLEKIDLNKKLDKAEYNLIKGDLRNRLFDVQKASWNAGIPVVILFEGWDAAGKGTSIQKLTVPLDPRGFKLYPIRAARTYEQKRPWLWRFWLKLPARGEWAIFDRSWYGRVLVERVEKLIPEAEWRRGYRDIVDFERTIADDGHLIIKFFLHISKKEQKRRFEKLIEDPLTAWHVSPEDWVHHRMYDEWYMAYEEMLERTDTEWGPWTIVEASEERFTITKIMQTVISSVEERLKALHVAIPSQETQEAEEQETDLAAEAQEGREKSDWQPEKEPVETAENPAPSQPSVEAQQEIAERQAESGSETAPSETEVDSAERFKRLVRDTSGETE